MTTRHSSRTLHAKITSHTSQVQGAAGICLKLQQFLQQSHSGEEVIRMQLMIPLQVWVSQFQHHSVPDAIFTVVILSCVNLEITHIAIV